MIMPKSTWRRKYKGQEEHQIFFCPKGICGTREMEELFPKDWGKRKKNKAWVDSR